MLCGYEEEIREAGKELEQRLEEARRKIRFHGRILHFGIALEILAAVMLIGIGIWILL